MMVHILCFSFKPISTMVAHMVGKEKVDRVDILYEAFTVRRRKFYE